MSPPESAGGRSREMRTGAFEPGPRVGYDPGRGEQAEGGPLDRGFAGGGEGPFRPGSWVGYEPGRPRLADATGPRAVRPRGRRWAPVAALTASALVGVGALAAGLTPIRGALAGPESADPAPVSAIGPGGQTAAAGVVTPSSADPGPLDRSPPPRSPSPGTLAFDGPFQPLRGRFERGAADTRFGASRGGSAHQGVDLFANPGTPLVAVRGGVVVEAGSDAGRGNYVGIYSPASGLTYVYLHMRQPTSRRPGERVVAGERVGAAGCTGACIGTHLHFELRVDRGIRGEAIDPMPRLRRWPQAPTPS